MSLFVLDTDTLTLLEQGHAVVRHMSAATFDRDSVASNLREAASAVPQKNQRPATGLKLLSPLSGGFPRSV